MVDGSRTGKVLVRGGVGDVYVHLQLEQVSALMRTAHPIEGEQSPRIRVAEPEPGGAPPEFTVTFDAAKILDVVARAQ